MASRVLLRNVLVCFADVSFQSKETVEGEWRTEGDGSADEDD